MKYVITRQFISFKREYKKPAKVLLVLVVVVAEVVVVLCKI